MIGFCRWADVLLVLALTNLWVLGDLLHIRFVPFILLWLLLLVLFVFINVLPVYKGNALATTRLRAMLGGGVLLSVVAVTFTLNLALTLVYGFTLLPAPLSVRSYILHIVVWLLASFILLLNGGIRVLATSVQLRVKWRALLLLLWWVPLINLFLLIKVCRLVRFEYELELDKAECNAVRRESAVCQTKYPLLLVHGVFFRDWRLVNYWGRVPKELLRNGAVLYYGEQQSAASVAKSGAELRDRIQQIVRDTGCGKVNIIAHSKGGLDSRYAISRLGMAPFVASLTTVNTPHRGCAFADYLLEKAPGWLYALIAKRYNGVMRRLGDAAPDFAGAVEDLTVKNCAAFNASVPDAPGVLYRSTGSKMKKWSSAPLPQNLSYLLVRHFSRDNDGLVSVDSMPWGESFELLPTTGRRGISHGDLIDLYKEDIRGFDVREFYVRQVKELAARGL